MSLPSTLVQIKMEVALREQYASSADRQFLLLRKQSLHTYLVALIIKYASENKGFLDFSAQKRIFSLLVNYLLSQSVQNFLQ